MTEPTLHVDPPSIDSRTDTVDSPRRRRIGPAGTIARLILGSTLVGSVVWGHARSGPDPWAWVIGLAVLPGLTIVWQQRQARRHPTRLEWLTGPFGHVTTLAVFLALYLTSWYAPPISVLSDAALIFYGTTMLVAAGRGYAGCEVLAISNWLLHRDDQVGCLLFAPIERIEARAATDENN
jgi:hypothetical protein